MNRSLAIAATLLVIGPAAWAQQQAQQGQAENEIQQRLDSYVDTFNQGDAAAVASYWTSDAVSVNQETGARTSGREQLQADFASFFEENPGARLSGRVDHVRVLRPDVAEIEGATTLYLPDVESTDSSFSAVLVKDGDQWLLSSSHEQELPTPTSSQDALQELEWLIGTWQDQSDDAQVTTTVRWSASQAFLIRSFNAQYGDGEAFEGTQVIGWNPVNKQIRTWTFNSDGSFGEGTAAKNGGEWMIKMTHVLSDGRLATATQVITRIDDDTLQIQKIGETLDGAPVPAAEPITVVRTGGPDTVSAADDQTGQGGTP